MNTEKIPTRILSWNAKVGRRPVTVVAALTAYIAVTNPHVLVLTESTAYEPFLRAAFGKVFRVYRKGSDVVVLVRRDMAKPTVKSAGHATAWKGPHEGKAHAGRRWLVLDWDGFRLIALHRVPGGPAGGISPTLRGFNKPAWNAEDKLLIELLKNIRSALVVGDQNAEADELITFRVKNGLTLVRTGAKVDWAMQRRAPFKGRRLGRRGSDHPAVFYKRPKR